MIKGRRIICTDDVHHGTNSNSIREFRFSYFTEIALWHLMGLVSKFSCLNDSCVVVVRLEGVDFLADRQLLQLKELHLDKCRT